MSNYQPDKEFFDFMEKHRLEEPDKLRLRFHNAPQRWLPLAINHIESLRKARRKFILRDGTDLTPKYMPFPLAVEQATSAEIAHFHAKRAGDSPLTVLDMTCGLGMDVGFLSKNPKRIVTAIEINPLLAEAVKYNFREQENINAIEGDSSEWLSNYGGEPFDLVFIDPARRGKEGQRTYNLLDCTPNLLELLPLLRKKAKKVMAKLSPMLDVSQTLRDLPDCTLLNVVEEGGECRELLAEMNFDIQDKKEAVVSVVCNGENCFSFTRSQEADASPVFQMPLEGRYLLEPGAAALKAGAFNLYATRFKASKLHPNTHLYLSDTIPAGFPGKTWKIKSIHSFNSKELKALGREIGRADVAVRNLPGLSAEKLRQRMGIKQGGGGNRLIGTTLADGSRMLLHLIAV